jgi:hypothetical protein
MAVRKAETFEPVTLGHICSHGCRDLLVYCGSIDCSHGATLNADHMPGTTRRSGRSAPAWSARGVVIAAPTFEVKILDIKPHR